MYIGVAMRVIRIDEKNLKIAIFEKNDQNLLPWQPKAVTHFHISYTSYSI